MKKLLNFFITIFILLPLYSQIDTISLNTIGVQGKVKSISEFTYYAVDSIGFIAKNKISDAYNKRNKDALFAYETQSRQTSFIYEYAPNGNMLKNTVLWDIGLPYETFTFSYNPDMTISTSKRQILFRDGTLIFESKYNYGTNGKLSNIKTYNNTSLFESKTYSYNEELDLVDEKEIDKDGNIKYRNNYSYKNNHLFKEYKYSDESFSSEKIYYFEENKLIKTQTSFSPDLKFESNYKYDKSGNITTSNEFRNGILLSEVINEYDSLNNIVKSRSFRDNVLKVETSYIYNSGVLREKLIKTDGGFEQYFYNNGLLQKYIVKKDVSENIFEYEYKIDKKNNWVQIVEYKNRTPIKARYRTIKYYN